jgi:hypothetical protein
MQVDDVVTTRQELAFVRRHGFVLQSGRGPVPNLADFVAGKPIRGGWWSHPQGRKIFAVIQFVCSCPDILVCKLVDGKVTYVHRRIWPALVRLETRFARSQLAKVWDEHMPSGRHRARRLPFPKWVPEEVMRAAANLTVAKAEASLPLGIRSDGSRIKTG